MILVMADDLGWGDTGYNGHPVLQTPHLDAMANSGLQFDRFYAAAPVCSPTRGSCLTGRHPSRYGIGGANQGHLPREEVSLAEVLQDLGYATGHFGKWHLGTLSPDFSGKGPQRNPRANYLTPDMAGFDTWFSTEYAVATWDPYDLANAHGSTDRRALYWSDHQPILDGPARGLIGCDSRIIMDRAVAFIDQAVAGGTPFLAVIWFHAPHAPVVGGPDYRARYADQNEAVQHYYAAVTALDEQVGRLRSRLRELEVQDQTMLWFCSDNGPEGNPQAKGRSQGSAGPFRGRKRSLYEGGVRVPAILEWPARIRAHRHVTLPAVTSDYLPTVLAVTGSEQAIPADRPLDGISLLPLIDGSLQQRGRSIGFQFQGCATLMDDRYKLVHNPNQKRQRSDNGSVAIAEWELYDLVNDPAETVNVAARHGQIVERMRRELAEWQQSCAASVAGRDY